MNNNRQQISVISINLSINPSTNQSINQYIHLSIYHWKPLRNVTCNLDWFVENCNLPVLQCKQNVYIYRLCPAKRSQATCFAVFTFSLIMIQNPKSCKKIFLAVTCTSSWCFWRLNIFLKGSKLTRFIYVRVQATMLNGAKYGKAIIHNLHIKRRFT